MKKIQPHGHTRNDLSSLLKSAIANFQIRAIINKVFYTYSFHTVFVAGSSVTKVQVGDNLVIKYSAGFHSHERTRVAS